MDEIRDMPARLRAAVVREQEMLNAHVQAAKQRSRKLHSGIDAVAQAKRASDLALADFRRALRADFDAYRDWRLQQKMAAQSAQSDAEAAAAIK